MNKLDEIEAEVGAMQLHRISFGRFEVADIAALVKLVREQQAELKRVTAELTRLQLKYECVTAPEPDTPRRT